MPIRHIAATTIVYLAPFIAAAQVKLIEESSGILKLETGQTLGLGTYLASVFKAAVYIILALAVILFMIAGVFYIWPTTGSTQEGKEIFWRVVGGVVLALTGYLILSTINPALVTFKGDFLPPLGGGPATPQTNQSSGGQSSGAQSESNTTTLTPQGAAILPASANDTFLVSASNVGVPAPRIIREFLSSANLNDNDTVRVFSSSGDDSATFTVGLLRGIYGVTPTASGPSGVPSASGEASATGGEITPGGSSGGADLRSPDILQ